jgi:hypothetical protein
MFGCPSIDDIKSYGKPGAGVEHLKSYGKQAKVSKIGVKFYEKEIFQHSNVRRGSNEQFFSGI